ncbi:unnamed protein product, partial [Prorocentrum cordatum]
MARHSAICSCASMMAPAPGPSIFPASPEAKLAIVAAMTIMFTLSLKNSTKLPHSPGIAPAARARTRRRARPPRAEGPQAEGGPRRPRERRLEGGGRPLCPRSA